MCYCATKFLEQAVTAYKCKTFKAVSHFILGKYRLRILADVVKNKLVSTVFSANRRCYE